MLCRRASLRGLSPRGKRENSIRGDEVNSPRGRRNSIRYPLEAPVVFRWKDEGGVYQLGEGQSRDVSERGVFVIAANCPPTRADVELTIDFAALPTVMRAMQMEVEGRVVRVEPGMGQRNGGFAVLAEQALLSESDDIAEKARAAFGPKVVVN